MGCFKYIALAALVALASCDATVAGGSATDIGNPTVVGRLVADAATGVLYGSDGEPISGAVVSMIDTAHNPLFVATPLPILRDTTDEDGRFSLKPLETMKGYTLFARFPDSLGFAFSSVGAATDSLEFTAPVGPTGSIELLYPKSAVGDTANLFLWLKGAEVWGSAGSIFSRNYTWGKDNSTYISLRLDGIPYGFTPELRWYNSVKERGSWLIRGYGIYGDRIQVVTRPCSGSICVQAVYRLSLNKK